MRDKILEKIVALVEEHAPRAPDTRPGPDTQILDGGLQFDSTALLELVVELECEFGCEIRTEELTSEFLGTVGTLVELVATKVDGRM